MFFEGIVVVSDLVCRNEFGHGGPTWTLKGNYKITTIDQNKHIYIICL